MDLAARRFLISASASLPLSPLSSPANSILRPHSHSASTSFPIIAIAIIGILATAFLLVSYYIFVIKCCLNWHRIDLLRRFSPSRRREETPMAYSPAGTEPRGLEEAMIRLIPVILYKAEENRETGERSFTECSVCLNEFREKEKLRIIPNCSHVFHIDCIDVWLQNNANCPLCRTSISLSSRFQIEQILNPRPSSQDRQRPYGENLNGGDEDFVVIELSSIGHDRYQNSNVGTTQERENPPREVNPSPGKIMEQKKKPWEFQKVTSMGDECIDTRGKDEQFSVQPIRRSFSMDSSGDRLLYMAVQEALKKQNKQEASELSSSSSNSEGCGSNSGRVKRSFFSFGHGSSRSRSSVQPVHVDH